MARVVVAYHSGFGHTARQAAAVAEGAEAAGAAVTVIQVAEIDDAGWAALDAADAVIFGTPTYMAGPSAQFKAFADATARVWFTRGWQDKLAAGFTNSASASGDKVATLQYLAHLAAQHGMQWVSLGLPPAPPRQDGRDAVNRLGGFLGALAQSYADEGPDVAPPSGDLATAEHLGRRVAVLAERWHGARDDARVALVAAPA